MLRECLTCKLSPQVVAARRRCRYSDITVQSSCQDLLQPCSEGKILWSFLVFKPAYVGLMFILLKKSRFTLSKIVCTLKKFLVVSPCHTFKKCTWQDKSHADLQKSQIGFRRYCPFITMSPFCFLEQQYLLNCRRGTVRRGNKVKQRVYN